MRCDINETLLRHLVTSGGAASRLRADAEDLRIYDMATQVESFFCARSDVRRLQRAQEVANTILQVNDFQDALELRAIVARQELRRLINYRKQKDHTAHTVYLYLLGLWFFDNLPSVRAAVRRESGSATEQHLCHWFLFQWLYASLLHDVGYAFYDLSDDTLDDRQSIDNMLSFEWLEALLTPGTTRSLRRATAASGTLAALKAVHNRWDSAYGQKMRPPTASYRRGACREVLDRLACAPWLGDIESDWAGKDIFDVLTIGSGADLRAYAYSVAKSGYTGSGEGCVDHAVASGLLLFQYTSYWYWLAKELSGDASAYKDFTGSNNYDARQMKRQILSACRATAYHNVQANVPGASEILKCITLESQPILYLAMVCDELQTWDRYPAGDDLLVNFAVVAAGSLEGEDLELSCSGTDERVALLRIGHPEKSSLVDRFKRALGARLTGFDAIVRIQEA